MADTGWLNPTVTANIQEAGSESVPYSPKGVWSNTNNILSSNNLYASTVLDNFWSGDYLVAKHFNMALPDCLTTLIEVDIEGKSDLTQNSVYPSLSIDGTNVAETLGWLDMTTSDAYYSFSTATPYDPAYLNSDNFAVFVKPKANYGLGAVSTIYVDHVRIKVTYLPLAISTTTLVGWTVNTAYSQTVTANVVGCTWDITVGALPTGLSLNASSGAITGTPTVAESQTFTVRATGPLGSTATKEFTIDILAAMTDAVSSVTETVSIASATNVVIVQNNNAGYILNNTTRVIAGSEEPVWTYLSNWPFTGMLYSTFSNQILGARRDTGQLAELGGDPISGLAWEFDTGYMDFGQYDEAKAMPELSASALKRFREFQARIKSDGDITLTCYTEEDTTTGVTLTVAPDTTDNAVYNAVRTAMSRDIRGTTIRLVFSGTCDFWMGKMAMRLDARKT